MDKPDRMRVTISFRVEDASMYEVDDLQTYMDGYRWLWDNDRSAALEALYEDDNVMLVNVEPIVTTAQDPKDKDVTV